MTPVRKWLGRLLFACALVVLAVQLSWLRQNTSMAALMSPAGRVRLSVPDGFSASVFAEGLAAPRFLEFGADGLLYVAEAAAGRVTALGDADGDGVAELGRTFAEGLPSPHSVAWHGGALYVGVPTGVVELRDADGDGIADARRVVVDDYPTEGHSTRTVVFLRDGRMVVSVGSSCNVCEEDDPRRAALVVYDGPSGKGERVFARGLRNAVGLALHPQTGEIWATSNGRDWLGDDLPPETINVARDGDDFGWPRCHAGDLVDPDHGAGRGCDGVKAPAVKMQAHSAPLGLVFYTAVAFPERYRGDLFVAFHGSWNRSVPTGYKVVRVPMDGAKAAGPVEDFATGFVEEASGSVRGRPVGVAVGPDGALYVSDDKGGFVYRIAWRG